MRLPPTAHLSEPPEGTSMVLIDTDRPSRVRLEGGGPHAVGRLGSRGRTVVSGKPVLCESTPCAVYLPKGSHELRFIDRERSDHADNAEVVVNDESVAVQHAFSAPPRRHVGTGIAIVAAGVAVVTATAIAAVAVAEPNPATGKLHVKGEARTWALTGAMTGAALMTSGMFFLAFGGVGQPDGGATHQWNPQPGTVAGMRLGARF